MLAQGFTSAVLPVWQRHNSIAGTVACLLALAASAQARPQDEPPWRRIYVPADRVGELGERYPELQTLPRTEFEDLLRRSGHKNDTGSYMFESSQFQASLDGDRLRGTAQFRLRGQRDASSLVYWPISQWHISTARWDSEDAAIGYAGRGQLGLVIPAGDLRVLDLDWTAPGRVTPGGRRFDLYIPSCVRAEWLLDLPATLRPVASGGSVTGPTPAPRPELQRWLIQWSPGDRVSLLVTDETSAKPFPALMEYERDLEADISAEATEIVARFRVTVVHRATGILEFKCSEGVEVHSWSGIKVRDSQWRDGLLQLALAEPLLGTEQITLQALSPGPAKGEWQLPIIELVGGAWNGGSVRLRGAPGLILTDLESPVRLDFVPGGAADRSEWILPHAHPRTTIAARALASEKLIVAQVQTAIDVGPELQANATVTWNVASGETNTVALRIPPEWTIHAVEGIPAPVVTRWSMAAAADGQTVITFHLNRPAFGGAPIVAQIRLRGPDLDTASSGTRLMIPRLRPVNAQVADERLTVRSAPLWSAELVESNQVTVVARSAESTGRAPPVQLRFDGPLAAGTLMVAHKSAEYSANLETQIEVSESLTQVRYQVDLEWPGTQSDTVEVRWTAATGESLRWELPAESQLVRLAQDGERDSSAEIWRVRLARQVRRRVRLIARWQTQTHAALSIPLPTLPEAATSTGTVILKYPAQLAVQTQATGLVAGSNALGARQGMARSDERSEVWRYGKDSPRLSLGITQNERLVGKDPWIAHALLRSSFDGSGASLQRLEYEMRNAAGCQFALQLPAGSSVRKVSSEGATVGQAASDRLHVSGPAALASWELQVEYSFPVNPLNGFGHRTIPIPQPPFSVAHFTWEVEAPSGYAALSWLPDLTAVPPHPARSWAQRLFGPLLRHDGGGVFRFWDANEWRDWWTTRWQASGDVFQRRLRESLTEFTNTVRSRDRTWTRLCAHLNRFTGQRLVIDAVGLERGGITLADVATLAEEAPEDLFGLASTGALNIVRSAHGLILTTRAEASQLARTLHGRLRQIRNDGGLPNAIDQATLHGVDASGRFVLFARYQEQLEGAPIGLPPANTQASALWRYEAANQPPAVTITMVQIRLIYDLSTMLTVFGFVLAFLRKTRPGRVVLLALSVIVVFGFVSAVIVPASLAPVGAALGWSGLLVIAARSRAADTDNNKEMRRPVAGARATAVAGLLLFVIAPVPLAGQVEQGAKVEPKELIAFIPFDPSQPEKRDESSRVLLPRATHQWLLESASSAAALRNLVLFRSTRISGRIGQDRLELGIDVELEKFAGEQSTRVLVPLGGMVVRSVLLDGRSCPVEAGSGGLYIDCQGAGRHELHIDAVLALDATGLEGTLEFLVPPAARSNLVLVTPPNLRLEVDSAVSAEVKQERDSQLFYAELASTGRLVARWSRNPANAARWRTDSASIFTWRGESAHLETRTTVNVEVGPVQSLTFEPDPRLALRQITAPGLAGYWLRSDGDKTQWVLEFERPIDRTVTVGLDCLVRDPPRDKIVIPQVHISGSQPGTRMVACRGAGEARIRVAEAREAAVAGAGEFAALWRDSPPRPLDAILSLPPGSPPIVVERDESARDASLQLQIELHATRGRVDTKTRVTGQQSDTGIRHELVVPPAMTLSQVRVSPGTHWALLKGEPGAAPASNRTGTEQERAQPHTGDEDRIVWMGMATGETAPFIEIDGWIPRPTRTEPLPLIRTIAHGTLVGSLTIWRARDLSVKLEDVAGMRPPLARLDLRPPSPDLVLERIFELDGQQFTATWNTELRSPRVLTTVATRVLVDDGESEWISIVDCLIADGAMQSLELIAPASLPADVQLSGEGILRRQVIQHGDGQLWKVELEQPQWHSYRFMWRARLRPDPVGRVAVPVVIPQQVAELRQFLLVLNATEQELTIRGTDRRQPVTGDTFARWFSDPITKAIAGSFQLDSAPGVIEVQPVASSVQSADHVVALERHRASMSVREPLWIESTFLIRSRSSGDFVLTLPPGSIFYDIRLDGRPLRPSTDTNGRLLVYIPENDRLYELVIRWRWNVAGPSVAEPNRTVTLPRLIDFDCPALWTVLVPTGWTVRSPTSPNTCPSYVTVAEAQALAKQLEYLIERPRASDDAERALILGDLENSLLAAAERARHTLDVEASVGVGTGKLQDAHENAARQLVALMKQNDSMLQRLSATGIRLRAETQTSSPAPASRAAARSGETSAGGRSEWAGDFSPAHGQPYFFVTDGKKHSIVVEIRPDHPLRAKLGPALLVCVAAWCIAMLLGASRIQSTRWCVLLGILGLLWCWKLQPEPVGPALLLGAAILSVIVLVSRRRRFERR